MDDRLVISPKMTRETADILRKQFPPEQIGKLPRGGAQLDYVGHADTTSRFLEADPEWNWEPLARDEHGLPLFDADKNGNPVGLWIRLTVAGVTRLGYGSCPSTQGDARKVLIGDALRNAGMRFGVALDLWAKGDRADPTAENPSGNAGQVARRSSSSPASRPASRKPATAPQDPPKTSEQLLEAIAKATTSAALNEAWKAVGTAGKMNEEIFTGKDKKEKITFKDYLYRRNDEIAFPKSTPAAEGDTGGGDSQ